MKIWYDAPRADVLIDRSKKLEGRAITLSRNNGATAKWFDGRYDNRTKTMIAIVQRTGLTSIISFMRPIELRRQNNKHSKLAYKMLGGQLFLQAQIRLMGIDYQKNLHTKFEMAMHFQFHRYLQVYFFTFLP